LPTAHSQTVTGSITGTVVARTNSVVAGAIQPPDEIAKQQREFTSSNGAFTFVDLASGQEGIKLHSIRLEAGDVNSSVEVSAELVHGTTDRSDDFPLVQIQETPVSGRAFPATIKGTLPVGGSLRMQTTGNGRRCECSRGEIPLAL